MHVALTTHRFSFGIDNPVELTAEIPVWSCAKCGFAYTDGRGEESEHAAICRHLTLLTPGDIRAIRKKFGLSRAELARLTRFSEKSIKRWETGALIQNASADRFLRLIDDPEVFSRLRRLHQVAAESSDLEKFPEPDLPFIESEETPKSEPGNVATFRPKKPSLPQVSEPLNFAMAAAQPTFITRILTSQGSVEFYKQDESILLKLDRLDRKQKPDAIIFGPGIKEFDVVALPNREAQRDGFLLIQGLTASYLEDLLKTYGTTVDGILLRWR